MQYQTLPEMFRARVALCPSGEAYRQYDPAAGKWRAHRWSEVACAVERWSEALRGESLSVDARIAILMPNGLDHVSMDQAALANGLVPVPLHVIDNPESVAYILADSGAELLFIDTLTRWRAIAPFAARFARLQRVIYRDRADAEGGSELEAALEEWLARAPRSERGKTQDAPLPQDLASIVYTSGTTGRAKGVMLSHRNVISNIRSLLEAIPVRQDDLFLSFLPLSHMLERTVGYYLPMAAGATVAFNRSVPQLMRDLKETRPTVLVSVPRIYERAYVALRDRVERRPWTRHAFQAAVDAGWRMFEYSQRRAGKPRWPARLKWRVLDLLIGSRARAAFGGRLRAAVTGGAPMPAHVARTLIALGLPILQGYGMTESAPVISCNTPQDNDPGSVGRALPGVAVRIGKQAELLTHSESVMLGYWQRPEESRAAIDPEGWLHTGDQARIDEGRIHIEGRIKDIIVTSTGEKIAPADVEAAIATDPLIEQVMVLGEQRPYLVAVAVLNRALWKQEAASLGLDPDDEAGARSPIARNFVLERMRQAAAALPRHATPREAWLTLEPWTVEAGLLTPTLKPKRPALQARYAGEIAELYSGHTS